jgi:hypothetical protein
MKIDRELPADFQGLFYSPNEFRSDMCLVTFFGTLLIHGNSNVLEGIETSKIAGDLELISYRAVEIAIH